MAVRTKILFLGFCAGERSLIQQWAAAGLMPTVQSLLKKGLSGPSISLPGFFIGSTWESFATGVTPAKHGIYCWEQLRPETYEHFRCLTHENFKTEAFWDVLSRAGRRVAVLDVPLSPYSKALNGIQLMEWGAHDAQYGFMTSPPELANEIVARFGQHPWRGNCDAERESEEFVQFRDDLLAGIATKTKITKHFLDQVVGTSSYKSSLRVTVSGINVGTSMTLHIHGTRLTLPAPWVIQSKLYTVLLTGLWAKSWQISRMTRLSSSLPVTVWVQNIKRSFSWTKFSCAWGLPLQYNTKYLRSLHSLCGGVTALIQC